MSVRNKYFHFFNGLDDDLIAGFDVPSTELRTTCENDQTLAFSINHSHYFLYDKEEHFYKTPHHSLWPWAL